MLILTNIFMKYLKEEISRLEEIYKTYEPNQRGIEQLEEYKMIVERSEGIKCHDKSCSCKILVGSVVRYNKFSASMLSSIIEEGNPTGVVTKIVERDDLYPLIFWGCNNTTDRSHLEIV